MLIMINGDNKKRSKASKIWFKFSSICKILHIVALCVQQIASMFWITPLPVFN